MTVNKEKFVYGIVGEYQVGKSTLVNCILGRYVASVGWGIATTHTIVIYEYSDEEYKRVDYGNGRVSTMRLDEEIKVDQNRDVEKIICGVRHPILKRISLIDLPGVGNDCLDNAKTHQMLGNIDCAILIHSSYKSVEEQSKVLNTVHSLQKAEIPYYVFLNCSNVSQWEPDSDVNEAIARRTLEALSFYPPLNKLFSNNLIPNINLMWYWYAVSEEKDELAQRYRKNFDIYGDVPKEDFKEASQFFMIEQIFDNMNSELYILIKRELRESIERLKDELCPIGSIQLFAYSEIPENWLPCDGRSLAIAEYEELFNKIGHMYSSEQQRGLFKTANILKGQKEGYFNIPNLNDVFVRGWNPKGSRKLGSCQDDALQGHGHVVNEIRTSEDGSHAHYFRYYNRWVGSNWGDNDMLTRNVYSSSDLPFTTERTLWPIDSAGTHTHEIPENRALDIIKSGYTDVRVARETRPKNIALLYCIRVR